MILELSKVFQKTPQPYQLFFQLNTTFLGEKRAFTREGHIKFLLCFLQFFQISRIQKIIKYHYL